MRRRVKVSNSKAPERFFEEQFWVNKRSRPDQRKPAMDADNE